jgi:GTP cyclohydrolase I
MAAAYAEMLAPRPFELTTFPNDEGYDELVLSRSIPLHSVCEHHMLPFIGVAHVGYLPGERIVGLSKLARMVEHFARRPQVQERLTKQVADWLNDNLAPRGVGVVVEAEHLCMTVRGVRAPASTTVTSTLLGLLRDDPRSRGEFLSLAGVAVWLDGVSRARLDDGSLARLVESWHVTARSTASTSTTTTSSNGSRTTAWPRSKPVGTGSPRQSPRSSTGCSGLPAARP